MTRRAKILIVDPYFGERGGALIVAHWMIEALHRDYDVTLFCWKPVDLAALHGFAGTGFDPMAVRQVHPPRWMGALGEWLNRIDKDDYSMQRWAIMLRVLKWIAQKHDVVISNNCETDFGRPGIQYIHFPYLRVHGAQAPDGTLRVQPSQRFRPWYLMSGFDFNAMHRNRTFANSHWTAKAVDAAYGGRAEVLYPPVPGDFPDTPWSERQNAAVCVGRLSRDKNLDQIIEICAQVRHNIPDFRLHIVGVQSPREGGDAVMAMLHQRMAQDTWITLHEDLPRARMIEVLSQCRIGLHGSREEHFGIAVAELLRAGCAVLCHDSGGQVEIAGNTPDLLYKTVPEAARRVTRLLQDDPLRVRVMSDLVGRRDQFDTAHFCQQMRAHVEESLAEGRHG